MKIGDRVSWWAKPELKGTIVNIENTDYPCFVQWDDGRFDWYPTRFLINETNN